MERLLKTSEIHDKLVEEFKHLRLNVFDFSADESTITIHYDAEATDEEAQRIFQLARQLAPYRQIIIERMPF